MRKTSSLLPTTLYLNMEMMNFMTSAAAYMNAKEGLLSWNKELVNEANELLQQIKNQEDPFEIQRKIVEKSFARLQKVFSGLKSYHETFVERPANMAKLIWQDGSSELYDYGGGGKNDPVMLFVPSLINRSYIFDLSEKNSMMKFFADSGIRTLMLNWGDPGEKEYGFGLEEYISDRLRGAIDAASRKFKRKVVLTGYCMGGLMSIAATLQNKDKIKGLALLATPWDFHAPDVQKMSDNKDYVKLLSTMLEAGEVVHGQLIYQLFYMMNPWAVNDKYAWFSELEPQSEEAKSFVEREQWLHDDVPLTSKVARECFIDWAANNYTALGKWMVDGMAVDPAKVDLPTLIAIPRNDKVVPPLSAGALSILMPNASTIFSPSGHIGMIAGKNAAEYLWKPLENWVRGI